MLVRGLALVLAALAAATLGARGVAVGPDLVVVLVVAWGLFRGPWAGAAAGLAGGWVVDLVPPGAEPLGAHALAYAVAGLLAGRLRHAGPTPAPRVAGVTLLGAAVVEAVEVLRALTLGAPVDLAPLAVRVLLTATVAAVLVPVVVGAERAAVRRRYG
ncbi:rod shape-determining protein MreD [Phycicoccus sp. BSK3Z-2]|uniref:Rod shape-determining protein MreD n=1 Tax=Phycicoccus avicenniae TaxID=2828860 RepID=A0A941HZV4_9MICO|nr:rod shape-determining protein MreD [Phycicoccus avicenniae]MBR7744503.1 rod shape-determining protein MreD [Phycicoccus avicenniae]